MWFASEVLPVVSVLALVTLVVPVFVVEWAPDCFEMEHVEIGISVHLVEHIDAQLILGMCKRA